eukprot:4583666-Amphidinium_carterae.1
MQPIHNCATSEGFDSRVLGVMRCGLNLLACLSNAPREDTLTCAKPGSSERFHLEPHVGAPAAEQRTYPR